MWRNEVTQGLKKAVGRAMENLLQKDPELNLFIPFNEPAAAGALKH